MPTTQSRLPAPLPKEPHTNQAAPLTRTIKPKTKAQERAEQKLLAERQAWDVEKIIAGQEAGVIETKATDEDPRWRSLLIAVDKHAAGSWALLDKALAPFCMGAPGAMNPKTGQYVTEIRMTRNQVAEVEQVLSGINTLMPYLKPIRGVYEFRIKCVGAKIREKNWLSLGKDGKAKVLSSLHPEASFDNLRDALMFIVENRPAAESAE
ncbi:MAG: hypothetical protein JWQ23_2576 [Herminiimonas sp.]|nr:hypothetical protein [Herminiimonas sp.]